MNAQGVPDAEPVLQLCVNYSKAGDLLKATVSAHAFNMSIARPSGQIIELNRSIPDIASAALHQHSTVPCQIAISGTSSNAALAISTPDGLLVQLVDLSAGLLTQLVKIPPKFPIQFSMHPLGFVSDSSQLAVSQAHYLPSGEPEVSTQLVNSDGSIAPGAHSVLGPKYSEISGSSFDFGAGRVWFLCGVYSARVDRQPRCTLTSASLSSVDLLSLQIPPPPDDRVVGSGQPELGFPSSDLAILLAQDRLWLYSFSARTFRQMNIPETPHYVRWGEFPGRPRFSSDGRFAAIPVYMFHYPFFQEGEVSHGTKIVVVDTATLQILQPIQPNKEESLIDLALHNNGADLKLVANWGKDWKAFQIPVAHGN